MNILLIRNADTSNFGGAETFVVNLASRLQETGHNVSVATAMPLLTKRLRESSISVSKSPWLNWQHWHGIYTFLLPLHWLWLIRLVVWYIITLHRNPVDVLHVMNRDDFIAGSIAGKLTRTPVVWTDHADLKHELANTRQPFKNLMGKQLALAARWTDAITVVSQAELDAISLQATPRIANKLTLIYNGVFDESVQPVKKPAETLVIGLTARLLKQKGLRELISAFKKLDPPQDKKLELWLIGEGPDKSVLKSLAGEDNRIKFLGFVSPWYPTVAALDVFAFPSYTEGFSLSLLEATMLGLPIVTSSAGGNPEIIEDGKTGLVVPTKDSEALRAAIQQIIDRPGQAALLGKAARARWQKDFDFAKIVDQQFVTLYDSVQ